MVHSETPPISTYLQRLLVAKSLSIDKFAIMFAASSARHRPTEEMP